MFICSIGMSQKTVHKRVKHSCFYRKYRYRNMLEPTGKFVLYCRLAFTSGLSNPWPTGRFWVARAIIFEMTYINYRLNRLCNLWRNYIPRNWHLLFVYYFLTAIWKTCFPLLHRPSHRILPNLLEKNSAKLHIEKSTCSKNFVDFTISWYVYCSYNCKRG